MSASTADRIAEAEANGTTTIPTTTTPAVAPLNPTAPVEVSDDGWPVPSPIAPAGGWDNLVIV